MSEAVMRMRNFLLELKRRKVFRVALMYGVVAWLLIQVAATTFPALQFPEWTIRFVIVSALLGFPVALLLSWAYELRPEAPAAEVPPPGSTRGDGTGTSHARTSETEAGAEPLDLRPSPLPISTHRIPPSPTPFVGRERDLAELRRLLADPACRLVTVCGPGGVGKTRFVLQAAMDAADGFRHGAAFVPLNVLSDAEPLVATIAERLGLPLSGRGDAKLELLAYLREKSLLLVLDNFEHLTASSDLLSEMLEQAPELRLLVTSRERLGLYGETLFPLEGLELPPAEMENGRSPDSEAIRLFVQSARRVQPHLSPGADELRTIARICRAVDGLPLAIELAAAWARALSFEQILRELQRDRDFLADTLRDVPERHRSMRAAFESAWRMLSDAERKAYRRLAVFRGGFLPEAAEEVAGASVPMLSVLLDKSLVRRSSAERFEVLEVLRQYAEDKLREDTDEFSWVRQHHCTHYAKTLDSLQPLLGTREEKEALDRIGEEIQNIREAWHWAVDHRLADALERALHCVFVFHEVRGRAQEGRDLFRDAAAALAGSADLSAAGRLTLLRLHVREAVFSAQAGRSTEACEQLDAAIPRLRERDAARELAFALDRRGVVAFRVGAYDDTRRFCEESLTLARAATDHRLEGWALMHLGNAAFAVGDYAGSERLHRRSLLKLEAVGDRRGIANCHRNLGVVAGVQGRHAEAQHSFQLGLSIDREIGNAKGVCISLQNLGHIEWLTGNYRQAEVHLREAVALSRELGQRKVLAACLNALGNVAAAQQDHAGAREAYHQALATAADGHDTPFVLEILVGIARVLGTHEGRPEAARPLLGLVLENPASDHDTRRSAGELLAELEELLPGPPIEPDGEPQLPLDAAVAAILSEGAAPLARSNSR
jgi:predicted ATPase